MNQVKNNRVLVIADIDENNLPDYLQEFCDKGFEVKTLRIGALIPKSEIGVRVKRLLGMDIRRDVRARKKGLEKEIIAAVDAYEPSIVVEINCMRLSAECADYIRSKSFLCGTMIDRIQFFPAYFEEAFSEHYDMVCTYSLEDYQIIENISHNCVFAPALADERIYYKIDCEKDIDVSFVGRMYPTKDYGYRLKILQRLVKDLPGVKIYVGGECAPIRRPDKYIPWRLNKAYRRAFINRNISQNECNEIYNRSKISLSIERAGTGSSWSGRLVNLLATETLVLSSDDGERTRAYFGGGMVFFSNYTELLAKIKHYLSNEEERVAIAQKGYIQNKRMSEAEHARESFAENVIARRNAKMGVFDENN